MYEILRLGLLSACFTDALLIWGPDCSEQGIGAHRIRIMYGRERVTVYYFYESRPDTS